IGLLSGRYIGKRGRMLFLVVIFLLLLMVNTAFGVVISGLLISTPSSVIPTWGAIAVALCIGQAIYRFKWKLPLVAIVGVVACYSLMFIGDSYPISLSSTDMCILSACIWIINLFIYAFFACLLPESMLLQLHDYNNGFLLFTCLGMLYSTFLFRRPV